MYCAQILSLCSACAHYGNRDRAQTFFLNNQLEVVPLKLRDFPPSPLDTSRFPPPTVPPSVLHDCIGGHTERNDSGCSDSFSFLILVTTATAVTRSCGSRLKGRPLLILSLIYLNYFLYTKILVPEAWRFILFWVMADRIK